MKKIISMMLVLAMVLCLGACGSSSTSSGSAESSAVPAVGETRAVSAADVPADAGEPVVLTLSCFDTVGSFNDLICTTFIDYVEKASGGNITFNYYQNGSYCSMMEDYDFVCNGSVDCSWTYPGPNMASIPWGYTSVSSDMEDSIALANYIYFNDEKCAEIVNKYNQKNGAICLGTCQEGGSSVCISTFEFDAWEDLKGHKNGATRDQDMYANMGHNVVALNQSDLYDSLSSGVCEFAVYNTASTLSNKLVEVAPYVYNTRSYSNALTYYMNYDKWTSLSAQQQQWIREGTEAAQAWSLENGVVYEEDLKAAATKWIDASDEDATYICQSMEQTAATICMMFAENLGGQEGLDDMAYILRVKEEWLGFQILPEEYASYRDSIQVTVTK